MLNFIRGFVRPYLAILFPTTIVVVTVIFASKFVDAEMTKLMLIFLLASGSTIVGVYFGERRQKAKK